MNKIILPYVSIHYIAPVIYCKYNDTVELGFPEVKELISCIKSILNGEKFFIFSDIYLLNNITKEGKRMLEKYYDLPFCKGASFFINRNRVECAQKIVNSLNSNYPCRVFSSGQEAIDWLFILHHGN